MCGKNELFTQGKFSGVSREETQNLRKINTTSYGKASRLLRISRILFGLHKREEIESLAMRYKER